ncbi:MAG: GNAT family N-acetyltransferase [Acidobacteria bacterium]|nr:GNAT family N-acetyltransferase [Acidobacteriota bacterium]
MPALPEPLPDATLARRARLPLRPDPVVLEGSLVTLRPLRLPDDVDPLWRISNGQPVRIGPWETGAYDADELVWRWMGSGPFAAPAEMEASLRAIDAGANQLALCVLERGSGELAGFATFMANSPGDLKIELGNIWYSPAAQRHGANTEATYLMLRHAFGLGYRRVEWKCNALNERSRAAALKMGFRFEGIQESHYIVKGRSRDTAWFRILDREWPGVEKAFLARLS